MSAESLRALADRCEALQGANRELNDAVLAAFGGKVERDPYYGIDPVVWANGDRWLGHIDFTRSLDAVRDLHARVLPNHRIEVVEYTLVGAPAWDCYVRNGVGRAVGHALGARTEEGGRLAAMLRAKAREG